ncbi:hypothetical protein KVR01_001255 [Diaporthe batatas]|uniref:uncharacterized protein n=1 Tax=Diaporthe batatas TaxID=748121 RepID=UPI001D047E79|nr:uncharacterized protein KVR01_001255 [Diaporthe batatas]KAG8168506.1 hypothetical protein KVR01_001255 [Diaporthe batatas]
MSQQQHNYFLRVPAEIRLNIYSYLLDDGGSQWLSVRNRPDTRNRQSEVEVGNQCPAVPRQSTKYHVIERTSMFSRRCFETTYHLASKEAEFHTAILGVCRLIYNETSQILYGKHWFEFGSHIEAIVPFLQDRLPYTRPLVTGISLYKRGPLPCMDFNSDRHEWSYLCRYLGQTRCMKKLRLVIEGGSPSGPWEGVQELSEADIRLLSLIQHESLQWITELSQVKGIEELDVVSEMKYLPVPKSPGMVLYAAISASIEKGLADFFRSEMNIAG